MKNLTLSAASALILACTSAPAGAQAVAPNLLDGQTSWQTVLDGVMGGLSTGRVRVSDRGLLTFTGKLSLENNGGFSQIRTPIDGESLADAEGLVLECRGDGRTYNFDLRVSNARRMAGGFQAQFTTVADEWTEIRLPFEEFRLFTFGRRVVNAPALDPRLIESIGVTLSDKNPGDFRLEVRSIRVIGEAAESAVPGQSGSDLVSVAKAAGLTRLLDCVTAAGLTLPKSPVTIFAPTNDAFAAIPKATLEDLLRPESRDTLRQILSFHVVSGAQSSADVLEAASLPSLAGQPLTVDAAALQIAGAGIVVVDVPFDGGVVHVIDKVMMPELRSISQVAADEDKLSTLLVAAKSADLIRQLERQDGPWTVFAPVNSAFAKLPEGTVATLLEPESRRALTQILGLHIVRGRFAASDLLSQKRLTTLAGQPLAIALKGGRITIGDGATMIMNDIQASNGIIHLIDSVLMPVEPRPAGAGAVSRELAEAAAGVYAAAINRGVVLFNAGNTDACAAVYEVAIEALLLLGGQDLGQAVVERLIAARKQGAAESSSRERAWVLRRALDEVYLVMLRTIEQAPRQPGEGIGAR